MVVVAQSIEDDERQFVEPFDDELCSCELVRRIARGDTHTAEAGAARRIESPARVLDGDAPARIERATGAFLKALEGE